MTATTITIPGKPFAKQRPRFSRAQGRAYTPEATVSFERQVGIIAKQAIPAPLAGPVRVHIAATFIPAKSWSKKKTAEHLHRPHLQKPDLDNLAKAILDGLNRIAFADDAQVFEITARKVWGITEQTIITVESV
jgi:Holliday junction resolvase RusA-like endonuclease